MTARVRLEGRLITLDPRDTLGIGGEATVYRHGALALKVYHQPAAHSAAKLAAFPATLPAAVVRPTAPLEDAATGAFVGFAMPLIADAIDVRRLAQRKWRQGLISNAQVTALMARLRALLAALHAAGVVVGDLNDGNVIFTAADPTTPHLIDADSWHLPGGFPCRVAHERFLDPRLLASPAGELAFCPDTDWYAFAVLLFSSLMYVHPYGGVHAGHPTLLHRAAARLSVLAPGVTVPKAAAPAAILPDPLRDWFEAVFAEDLRGPAPDPLLALTWRTCPRCGLEHARSDCPACWAPPAPAGPPRHRHGRCRVEVLLETRGLLLAADPARRAWLTYQDGAARREDGQAVLRQDLDPALRFVLAGRATWIGRGEQVVGVAGGRVVGRVPTAPWQGEPVMARGSGDGCVHLDGHWLIDGATGRRLGQLLGGRTWLACDGHRGFAFYRAGQITHYALFSPDAPGLRAVTLPALEGRVLEAAVAFASDWLLFEVALDVEGRRVVRRNVVTTAGQAAPVDPRQDLGGIGGKALVGSRLFAPTDGGVLELRLTRDASGDAQGLRLTDPTLHVDTEPFVSADASLHRGPQGSLFVVERQRLLRLSLASTVPPTRAGGG